MSRQSHDKGGWRDLLAAIEAAGGRWEPRDGTHIRVFIPGCRKPVHLGATSGSDKTTRLNQRALLRRSGLAL